MDSKTTQENLKKIAQALQEEGLAPEEIEQFVQQLNTAVSDELYSIIMAALDEEDLQFLQSVPEEQVATVIQDRFQAKTGQSTEDICNQLITSFAEKFLEEIRKAKSN